MAVRPARFMNRLRTAWMVHGPGRVRAHPQQMCPTGAVLDRDQDVDPPEHDGVYVREVHGQDGVGLGSEELAPGRTRPAWRGLNADVVQDLPDRGGRDAMAKSNQLAPHTPMPQLGFSVAMRMASCLIAAAVGDARVGGVRCSPIYAS
ncbi:MAG TPA: hypothetical protein VFO16_25205 [Pseudonocardiaceae bacterium]|nr:hypothetical protein [Pseudonocardiaceae bacterium]